MVWAVGRPSDQVLPGGTAGTEMSVVREQAVKAIKPLYHDKDIVFAYIIRNNNIVLHISRSCR